MEKDWFYSAACHSEYEKVISKSRFIVTVEPIEDYDEAIEKIKAIGKKYSDATHNCYAFISNDTATEQRFSDDGEPQGTAGIPMLEVLKKRKMYKTLVVVTRYFGGVKLGASGLVGAYSSAVSEALDAAEVVKNVWADIGVVNAEYGLCKKVEEICKTLKGEVIGSDFDKDVKLNVALPSENTKLITDKIVDYTQGRSKLKILESKYYKFKVIPEKASEV